MTSCRVILTSRISIFRHEHPTTFELCYAIFKISATDRCCFFYEEAEITTDFSHIGSSTISCCFPIPFAFSHHVYPSPYFQWFCIYSCCFPRCSPFIQPFTNFPGYPWRGGHTTQSCPSVHGEPFSFSQFVFIKLFNFQVAHLSMLDAGGQEGYCNYRVRKAFYNFYMDLPAALVNPDWDQWKIEAPQVGVRYPLVCVLFLFISFISDFIYHDRMNGVCSISTSSGPTLSLRIDWPMSNCCYHGTFLHEMELPYLLRL